MTTQTRVLGTFTLAMITMAAIVSLRNLPLSAELGFEAVFYLCAAGLVFFIPISLVTAELASSWPQPGGCYVWVSHAFGKPIGFLSLWVSWMASVAWFPAILAFTAAMVSHVLVPVLPNLVSNKFFIFSMMMLIYWGTTIANFFGIKISGWISTLGVVLGTLIPGILIIVLGVYWIFSGEPTQIALSFDSFVPKFKLDTLTIFSGVLLSLSGVELAAYHIREAKAPKNYPYAVAIAAGLILLVYILGTLSIAALVPLTEISLASGLVQAFEIFFNKFGIVWIVPLLALFLFFGSLAGINSWIIGPAKGLLVVAQDGFLPKTMCKQNANGVPVSLLIFQAIIGSLLGLVFLYMDDSAGIWILTALSAQFTFVQYSLVFWSGYKLRKTKPEVHRVFKAPMLSLVVVIGSLCCIVGFLLVYFPPAHLLDIGISKYCLILTLSFLLLVSPPMIWVELRRRSNNHNNCL